MAVEGTVVEKLIVEWRADYSKLTQDIDKIKNELKKTQSETEQAQKEFRESAKAAEIFGNGLNSIVGKAARAAAAIFSVHRSVGYLKNSIQLAMDVVESDSLFETTMGRWTDATRKWADAMEHSLGVNAFEVRKNVGTWYTMTKSMGLAEEQALAMSKNLVQLKYDLESFYNIEEERAESVIEGMITGITAPAKQIGVVLTEEMAKRELLAAGIIKQGQAADATTMMYGRYLALMKQTETAHGDMARTIDSPANQLRVMQSALRNASLEMGQAFLPIIQTVLPWLQYLAAFIKIVANSLASLFGAKGRKSRTDSKQAELVTGLGGVSHGVAEGEEGWKKYGNTADVALGKARRGVKDLQAAIMGFDQIHKVEEKTAASSSNLAPATLAGLDLGNLNADIDDVLGGLDQWIDKTTEIDEKVQSFIDALANSPIGAFGQTIFDVFSDIYNDILKPLGSWLLENSEFTIGALEGILLGVLGFKVVGKFLGPGSPVALAIGIIAGLAGAIDGFLRESMRKKMLEDMAGRWGDIALSAEQVDRAIEGVFDTLGSQLAREALQRTEELATKSRDWERALQGIISETYSFTFGVKIEGIKQEELKKGIDNILAEGQKLISEAKFDLPLTFANVNIGDEMLKLLMSGYDDMEADFIDTGERLRRAFDNAIADGIITDEEFNLIRNLQLEIADIMRRATDVESQIALEQIYKQRPGVAFTEESFRAMQQSAEEWRQDRYETAQALHIKQRALIEISPELTEDQKQDLIKKLEDHYSQEDLMFQLRDVKFQIGTIKKAFSDVDFDRISDFLNTYKGAGREDLAIKHLLGIDSSSNWRHHGIFTNYLNEAISKTFQLKPETRKNIESFYSSLKPTQESLMVLYQENRRAGNRITESIAAGLLETHSVGVMAGNVESLNFMLGVKMSKDPSAQEMLRKARATGRKINEDFAAGMESGLALPSGVTDELFDLLFEKLQEGGLDIQSEIEELGYSIPETLSDAMQRNKHLLSLSASELAKVIIDSFTTNLPSEAPPELVDWLKSNEDKLYEKVAPFLEKGMSLADAVIAAYSQELSEDKEAVTAATNWVNNNAAAINNNSAFANAGRTAAGSYRSNFIAFLRKNPLQWEMETRFSSGDRRMGAHVNYYPRYAGGGLPEIGEMFVAREAGPEFVGRMGSRTVVANNDQIVASVEAGVFRAVVAALGGGGMQRDSGNTYVIPVYVGGEKLYEVVFDRAKRESIRAGRPLMEGV